LLLDIRAVPISHKKGFSKNQLAAQLRNWPTPASPIAI
jgi:hypothetical protein